MAEGTREKFIFFQSAYKGFMIWRKTNVPEEGICGIHSLWSRVLGKIVADDILFFDIIVRKIKLGISCESSARQTIHMKCLIFSEKTSPLRNPPPKKNSTLFAAVMISTLKATSD